MFLLEPIRSMSFQRSKFKLDKCNIQRQHSLILFLLSFAIEYYKIKKKHLVKAMAGAKNIIKDYRLKKDNRKVDSVFARNPAF